MHICVYMYVYKELGYLPPTPNINKTVHKINEINLMDYKDTFKNLLWCFLDSCTVYLIVIY